jgi:hypothetical protein
MARGQALQQAGLPMFITRYEELSERPLDVLVALLGYCGARFRPEDLVAVIARDSQEGTGISRMSAQASGSELTEDRRLAFRRCLVDLAPAIDPDGVLPGTYGT